MEELKEIKKGSTGHGLLIESDGFISSDVGNNKQLFESYRKLNEGVEGDDFHCPYPFIVDAVFQKYGIKNANGRIYPEHVLKREVERYMTMIKERRALGECNHPSESVIDLSRVGINIIELHWEGCTLVGKMEIITSPGFRKHGIISCQGDQIANLLLSGYKIGVSSRGLGTVTQKMGVLYVADDYEIVCWDVVSEPSTPGSFVAFDDEKSTGKEKLQQYVENNLNGNKSNKIFEKLDKLNDWLMD